MTILNIFMQLASGKCEFVIKYFSLLQVHDFANEKF